MPTFFLNTDSFKASNAFVATLNAAPGATYLAQINAVGLSAAANAMLDAMSATTAATKATAIAANLGLTGAAATSAESYLTTNVFTGASSTWGAKLLAALDLFTTLQNDATFGTAATAYVARVNSAVAYSSVATNNSTDLATLSSAIGSAGSSGAGSTINFTTSADNLSGTGNNDTFAATYDVTSGTLSSADAVDGRGGTDTLSIRATDVAAGGATIAPSLTSIEILTIDNDDATAADEFTFNTASAAGITNINFGSSAAASMTTVTNVAANATVGLTSTRGNAAIDWGSTVFATSADSVAVTVNGAGDAASGGTAVKLILDATAGASGSANDTVDIVTITTSTAASRVNLAGGSAVKTLNISGDANLILTDSEDTFSSVTSVAASSLTGLLNIDLSSNTRNVTLTTGSGNDRVMVGAIGTGLTSDDNLNAGSGTDTVVVTDSSFDAADLLLIAGELSTFEAIEIATSNMGTGQTAVYTMSDISIINALTFSTAGTGTAGSTGADADGGNGGIVIQINGVEAGDSLTVSATSIKGGTGGTAGTAQSGGQGGAAIVLNPLVDTGSNSVTITLSGGVTISGGEGGGVIVASSTGATAGKGGDGITASSFETVNIVSSGTSTNTIQGGTAGATGGSGVAALAAVSSSIVVGTNANIVVTGARALNLGTIGGTNANVDASAFTAALTVTGEAGNNTITGGSSADTIDGGLGIDTLTGNAGADIFNFKLGSNTNNSGSSYLNMNGAAISAGSATTVTSVDSITDYVKGTDLISVSSYTSATAESALSMSSSMIDVNGTAAVASAAIASTGIATFAAADDTLVERVVAVAGGILAADATSAGDLAVFEFSGSTYVFISDATDYLTDGDILIRLTGVTGIVSVGFSNGDLVLS